MLLSRAFTNGYANGFLLLMEIGPRRSDEMQVNVIDDPPHFFLAPPSPGIGVAVEWTRQYEQAATA